MTRLEAILGAGGTGKSFAINQLVKEDIYYGYRTASTGMAAVSMGNIIDAVEPTTINRALRYFDAESLLRSYCKGTINVPLKYIASKFKNIIIDEISMIPSSVLDLIVLSLDRFNKEFKQDLGLIVCGK